MDRIIRVNWWDSTYSIDKEVQLIKWSELKSFCKEKVFHNDKESGRLFNGAIIKDENDEDVIWNRNAKGVDYIPRSEGNIAALDLLMLDYDNNPTCPPTKEGEIYDTTSVSKDLIISMLEGYEYVLYPTHSDLKKVWIAEKGKDDKLVWGTRTVSYGNGVERFRVVIPFASTCPKTEFNAIVNAKGFNSIIPEANSESFVVTQFFYEPRYPIGSSPVPCSGDGKLLDWTTLPKQYLAPATYTPPVITGKVTKGGKGKILIQTLDIVRFCNDMGLKVGRGGGWMSVTCPWENEHSSKGGTHIHTSAEGWGFSCKHNSHGKKGNKEFIEFFKQLYGWEVFRPYCDCEEIPDKIGELIVKAQQEKKLSNEQTDAIMNGTADVAFVDEQGKIYNLEQLRESLEYLEIRGVTCACGEEGLGKTYIVILLAAKGTKFILCCKSNEQAEKKAEELNNLGLVVRNIQSKEFKFKLKYGIGFERYEPTNPYEIGSVDIPSTVQNLMNVSGMTQEEAEEAYNSIEPDRFPIFDKEALSPLNKNHPLRRELKSLDGWVTTFAQMKGLLDGFNKPFRFITIIIDDPDVEDVSVLRPYLDRYQTARDNGVFDVVTIDNKEYCKIDRRMLLCHSVENNVLFTTTELCTQHVINHNYNNVNNYTFFRDVKIDTGNVFFVKSVVTQRRYHHIFHLYEKTIKRVGSDVELIADGIQSKLNLSNNKGRNDLKDSNIIIKISRPHPDRVRWLCAELGVKYTNWKGKFRVRGDDIDMQMVLDEALMLDVMNQAIGRNSGNRFSGKETVVFVPNSEYGNVLIKDSRYMMRDCSVRDKGFAKTVWDNIGKPEHMFARDDFVNSILRCMNTSDVQMRTEVMLACNELVQVSRLTNSLKEKIKGICEKYI